MPWFAQIKFLGTDTVLEEGPHKQVEANYSKNVVGGVIGVEALDLNVQAYHDEDYDCYRQNPVRLVLISDRGLIHIPEANNLS